MKIVRPCLVITLAVDPSASTPRRRYAIAVTPAGVLALGSVLLALLTLVLGGDLPPRTTADTPTPVMLPLL